MSVFVADPDNGLQQKTEELVRTAGLIKNALGALDKEHPDLPQKVRNLPSSIFMGDPITFSPPPEKNANESVQRKASAPVEETRVDEIHILRQENSRLSSTLEATKAMEAKLMARIEALESRATAPSPSPQPYPARATKPAEEFDGTSSFLRHKLGVQNSEIQDLKARLLAKKDEDNRDGTLTTSYKDLQKRYSRQALELKSVLDQNDILRRENRRLIDGEAELRRSLLAQPRNAPASPKRVDAQREATSESEIDENVRKNLLKLVDEEVRRTTEAKNQGAVHTGTENRVGFPSIYHLDIVLTTLYSLRPLLQAPLSSSLMSIIQTLVHSALGCASAVLSMAEESRVIEARIAHIGEESVYVRQETEKTLSDMYYHYEGELEKLRKEKDSVEESLRQVNEKQLRQLQERATSPVLDEFKLPSPSDSYPTKSPQTANMNNDVLQSVYDQVHELSAVNQSLKEKCEGYQVSIGDYKREIALLRASGNAALPKDAVNNSPRIMELKDAVEAAESNLEDERLRNQKATELIKVLKEQLQNARKQIQQHHASPEEKLAHGSEDQSLEQQFERIMKRDLTGRSEAGIGEIEVLMGMIRENDHSGERFKEIAEMIEDQSENRKVLEKKVKSLTKECKTLKESLDHAVSNESVISDKYKACQKDIKKSRDLYNECTRVLEEYEKMWKECAAISFSNGIQNDSVSLAPFDPTEIQTHPLAFNQYYNYLASQYTSLSHSFSRAKSQHTESSKLAADRSEQIETLVESLRVKVESESKTKEEMHNWKVRVGSLEEEKRLLENKLKKVVTGFKVIMQD